MRAFRLYTKGRPKQHLAWVGALLIIIAIVIAVVGGLNYFKFPEEAMTEFEFSPQALIVQELYVAGGLAVIGVVLLLAGTFAANHNNTDQ